MHDFQDIAEVSIACAAAGTAFSGTFTARRGFVAALTVTTPNFTNAITTTVTIKDANDKVVWRSAALARNLVTPHSIQFGCPVVAGQVTIELLLSGAAGGAGGNVLVKPWILQ